MDEIRRLLRVAARRNSAEDYTAIKFRVLKTLGQAFRRQCAEDSVTPNVVMEAVLRGYVNRHPAVMAMIDEWIRQERPEEPERKSPRLSKRELEEIYAAAGSGMIDVEEIP